ncbi:DUF6221 family protein [Paenarthrobacter sp. GOM3]|uniref:DUF6221 family protein n=1 Tax=Paenarthrobacter sp. GOM3 TaxID=2782567 RepID=UPI001BAC223C|nr:DUF6221 family protein [Paenarthrobacter sp. GOM3]WOH20141.1 DUF6221 family protein [Paenarthrobacter sp. GOM3]
MNIIEFLEARLDEDEMEARDMAGTEWYDGGWPDDHCNKILAESETKRAIIAQCRVDHEDSLTRNDDTLELATVVLYLLAQVYSAHPDYDPGWTE